VHLFFISASPLCFLTTRFPISLQFYPAAELTVSPLWLIPATAANVPAPIATAFF
jgi:hypothetical protein